MHRERVQHPMAIRHLTVSAVRRLAPTMVRVTLTGDELVGFASPGPGDHVKVFFPDPATGVLTTPELTPEGVRRPTDGVVISRDYTPLVFRRETASGTPELDIDFVVHGDDGPASAWAARAKAGERLAVAGPRGSRLAPTELSKAVLVADETALPALSRWVDLLPTSTEIVAIVEIGDDELEGYFGDLQRDRFSVEWLYRADGPGQLEEAVRSLGPLDESTYVWAAGEAGALVPIRRYLRRELGLGKDQVDVDGYWKRGITNRDHHDPVDPTDPD